MVIILPFKVVKLDLLPYELQELCESWTLLTVPKQLFLLRLRTTRFYRDTHKSTLFSASNKTTHMLTLMPVPLLTIPNMRVSNNKCFVLAQLRPTIK